MWTRSEKLFQVQKSGGRAARVGPMIRAVDFAQRNGDVAGWPVGHSEWRGSEVYDDSDISAP